MVREPDKNDYLYSILFLGVIACGVVLFKFPIQTPSQIGAMWDNLGSGTRILWILGVLAIFVIAFRYIHKKEMIGVLLLFAAAGYSYYTGNAFWTACVLSVVIAFSILTGGQTYFHNLKLAREIQSTIEIFNNNLRKNDFSGIEHLMATYDYGFEMRKKLLFNNHEQGFIDKKLEKSTSWKEMPSEKIKYCLNAIAIGDSILSKLGVPPTTENQKNIGKDRKEIDNNIKIHARNMKLHIKSVNQKELQRLLSETYTIKKELEMTLLHG